MKPYRSLLFTILVLILPGLVILAACGKDQEPQPSAAITGAPVTLPSPASPTVLPAVSPSALPPTNTVSAPFGAVIGAATPPGAVSTATPSIPATPLVVPTQPTIVPGAPFGPVVGSDYTLPPTETRLPPALPTAAPVTVPATPAPSGAFGALVGPGYTLPPTETRLPPSPAPTTAPTAGPSPTPYPGLDPTLVGVQIHANSSAEDFQRVLGHAHDLNVTWIKIQFNWSLLEFAPGVFTELFYGMRRYVQQAHDDGFKVMVSVAKAPGWARTPGPDGELRESGPPDDPKILADFLSRLLVMFGMDSSGQPFISAIEVWNEPNLEREWYGHPLTGEDYMRYFRPAYDAIRAWSPAITIITAAPAPTGNSVHSTDDRAWLQQLYNAGLASYGADVQVGIHPYGWANAPDATCCASPSRGWDDRPQFFFLNTIEDYRRIMVANGHGASHLWTTEFGWPTFDGLTPASGGPTPPPPSDESYFGFITQWQQADFTLRAFALAQQRDYMGPMILWNLNFSTVPTAIENGDKKAGYSLLTGQWQPRPVYQSLKQALTY